MRPKSLRGDTYRVLGLKCQSLVDGAHGARSLTHGGCDSLHRAVPDIAGGEYSKPGRLERKCSCCLGTEWAGQLAIGEDKPIAAEQHRVAQPRRRRAGADEAEQTGARDLVLTTGLLVRERNPFEMVLARERLNFNAGHEIDSRVGLDPLDQVLRHALGEILPSNRDRDTAIVLGQVDRGLTRGVSTANDHHRSPAADARLEICRGVVNAGALEALEILDLEPPIARPGGEDRRECRKNDEVTKQE